MNRLGTIILAVLMSYSSTTVKQQQHNHVSDLPPSRWFDGYSGLVVVSTGHAKDAAVHATSEHCGRDFYYAMEAERYTLHHGPHPEVLIIDQWDWKNGVNNCGALTIYQSGPKMIHIERGGATELSIDHYELFTSVDREHLKMIMELAPSTTDMDLSRLSIKSPLYVYIKAVGKPLYNNMFSNGIEVK